LLEDWKNERLVVVVVVDTYMIFNEREKENCLNYCKIFFDIFLMIKLNIWTLFIKKEIEKNSNETWK
jgi:hypothetical protein